MNPQPVRLRPADILKALEIDTAFNNAGLRTSTRAQISQSVEEAVTLLARYAAPLAEGKSLVGYTYDFDTRAETSRKILSADDVVTFAAAAAQEEEPTCFPFEVSYTALDVEVSAEARRRLGDIREKFAFVADDRAAVSIALACRQKIATMPKQEVLCVKG